MVDAETDPSGVGGDVVDAIGHCFAEFGDDEVMHPDWLGLTLGAQLPSTILEVPDKFLFLVSTEIAGSPAAWKAVTSALMCSNWALRSGWLAPARVLALACRLKPSRRNSRPTSFWPAVKPLSASAADRWRWLLLTHIKGASGSPRMDDCTNSFKAAKIPGWVSIAGLPPPPCRRTRMLDITGPERRSARPRSIVLRARPVACDTATTPPRPAARASLAANNRRPFLVRTTI